MAFISVENLRGRLRTWCGFKFLASCAFEQVISRLEALGCLTLKMGINISGMAVVLQ